MTRLESEGFNQQIQDAQDRFDFLKQRITHACPEPDLTVELIEELSTALVELHIAAEEMQEQHDHLLDVRLSLETERQRYQDLFEFAPDGYLVTDIAGHIQEVNQAAAALMNIPCDRLVGRLFMLRIPLEERKVVRDRLRRMQETRQPIQNLECSIQQPNGTPISCELSASPICHPQGYLLGFRWLIRDISERKQIAELEIANRVKDEFLAIVSHELRSPLNSILGWSVLLRGNTLDAQQAEYALGVVERNARNQVQLIEDLLDVSWVLRGQLSLKPAPVNLISVIRAALGTVQLAAISKEIEIKFVLKQEGDVFEAGSGANQLPALPPYIIFGDSARLQQILWNLLSNAIKFTPVGGAVEVRLTSINRRSSRSSGQTRVPQASTLAEAEQMPETTRQPPTNFAQITVTDNGRGISAEFLPHVFEYFRQADSKTTRQQGGLGLGLAIVRHLVELHGGTVKATSPGEGQGASFTVKLPLMPQDAKLDVQMQMFSAESTSDLSGLHILVIDDESDSREFVAFVLTQAGARVSTAASAREGLLVVTQLPDIILSDIGMPDMDGYTLMRHVRALPPEQGGQAKAIALTAYAGEIDHQQAIAAGFQRHLPKPVSPTQLIEEIVTVAREN
jgi:PAS domain S-box-containing protein